MKYIFPILAIVLCSSPVLGQLYNYDSLSLEVMKNYENDRVILPVYERLDADFHYEEFDLKNHKVKERKGAFNIEVTICNQKVILPKYHDLGGERPLLSSLVLENGNILVVSGWIRSLVVGHKEYNNAITIYESGID